MVRQSDEHGSGERQPLHVLTGEGCRVISLVGAGGKTSLMYGLARELRGLGRGVICTTTTHILPPTREQCDASLLTGRVDKSTAIAKIVSTFLSLREPMLTVGQSEREETGKWTGLPPDWLDALVEQVPRETVILIEADGAARHSLKVPAEHEPVISACTDCCIAVMGLDAVGKTLNEQTVHRLERTIEITGQKEGTRICAETLARMTNHSEGLFRIRRTDSLLRRVVFCNKLDLEEETNPLQQIAQQASGSESRACWGERRDAPIWYAGSVRDGFCILLRQGF